MKRIQNILLFTLFMAFATTSFAANDANVCSQIVNKTDSQLIFSANGKDGFVNTNEKSQVFVLPDASSYQLLNGEITVYAGGVEITKDGSFNMQYENFDAPADINCVASYKLYIYK